MYTTTTTMMEPTTIPTTAVSVSTAATAVLRSSIENMDASVRDSDVLEQVQALLQAADLLSQLAAMDTAVYQSTLSGQCTLSHTRTGTNQHQQLTNDQELGSCLPDAFRLQQSLDQIQRHWKLEDTPVPLLTRSIHRLHSGLAVLRAEADQQAKEILSLQEQVTVLLHNNGKLERAATRLHGKNEKCVLKLLHNKREKRSLIRHVKDLFAKMRDSEEHQKELQEFNVLYKLQAHEQILLMQQTSNPRARTDSNFSDADPRERSDSNFSNADALDFNSNTDDDDSSISSSVSSALVRDNGFGLGIGRIAAVKLAAGHPTTDTEPTLSTATTTSYASEDSNDSFSWWSGGSRTVVLSDPSAPYTLTFLRRTKIGLKIRAVPLDDAPKLSVHKGLLNDAILQGDEEHAVDGPPKPKETKKAFSLGFNLDALLGKTPNATSEKKTAGEAKLGVALGELGRVFVVSGYNEFDADLNTKPAIGTRIIAIDGHVIDNMCTMEMLTERLEECSGKRGADEADNCCTTFSVCFRNDPLTKKQRDWLGLPPKGPPAETGTARESNEKDKAQATLDNADVSMPKQEDAKATRLPGLFPFLKSNNTSTPHETGSDEICVKDRADVPTAPSDQCVDTKGDPPMPVPANATIGDSKARGGPSVFPFWKIGHATALRDSAGEKESITNKKTDELDAPPATTTTTTEESKADFPVNAPQKPEEKATAKTGMLAFWKMGSSSAVVEKKGQPIMSDLKDSVDKPSNDHFDADSSTPDGGNNKTQAGTKEQLTAEKESTTNEKTNELDATPATTTTTTEEEESKADSAVDAPQKPEEKATAKIGNSDVDAPQKPEEKATAKTGMMAFWKMGSSSAVVERNGQLVTSDLKVSVGKSSNDHLNADSSTPDGGNNKMLAFWKMGSSSAVVEKKVQPMTSDLKDSVDESSHDQLVADSSIPDGDNNKTQVAMEEQLSHGAVAVDKDADADTSDEAQNSMQSM